MKQSRAPLGLESWHRRGDHWIRHVDGDPVTSSTGAVLRYATPHPPEARWAHCTHAHQLDAATCSWCGAPPKYRQQKKDEQR